ncbi:hypothetical protein GQ607_007324 [Colletotrichum asianum]|uniref:Uncharacterized protein n=1 Tax=Colletotrichum asianum TaxID=702518 RepID=A0A8H3WCP7_9PEZI|nr:hypothetical protein GQ607_007324 [Colletotrichum asianum]
MVAATCRGRPLAQRIGAGAFVASHVRGVQAQSPVLPSLMLFQMFNWRSVNCPSSRPGVAARDAVLLCLFLPPLWAQLSHFIPKRGR